MAVPHLASAPVTPLPPAHGVAAFKRRRILFIEDDDNDAILVRHALEKAGLFHDLIVVEDSPSAIAYLRGDPPFGQSEGCRVPDLVVVDLKLVGSSGLEVLAWIGTQPGLRGMPVVVFSSSVLDEDERRARELGASDYMIKPGGFHGLMAWGRELHARWLSGTKPS